MAGERGAVSVGDLVRALRTLDLPASALSDVAELLGFATPTRRAPVTPPLVGPVPATTRAAPRPREAPAAAPRPEPPLPAPVTRRPSELIVHPPLPTASRPPRPVSAPLAALVDAPLGRPRRPPSLFDPGVERAIAGALVSTWQPDGEPDVAALVPRLASGEAIPVIPRRPVRTTRLGVRLLVDVGVGMLPFAQDAERFAARLEQLVLVERLDFERSPLGEFGRGWDWGPWAAQRPLAAGRPVLALTDFGLGGRVTENVAHEWRAFARTVAAARSSLVLLVPYPRARWPRGVGPIVPWDRSTSVREARR